MRLMKNAFVLSLVLGTLSAQATVCFSRTYSGGHLARHSAQKTKSMVVRLESGRAQMIMTQRSSVTEYLGSLSYCEFANENAANFNTVCTNDYALWTAGKYSVLMAVKGNEMKLRVTKPVSFCSDAECVDQAKLKPKSADSVFILSKVACE